MGDKTTLVTDYESIRSRQLWLRRAGGRVPLAETSKQLLDDALLTECTGVWSWLHYAPQCTRQRLHALKCALGVASIPLEAHCALRQRKDAIQGTGARSLGQKSRDAIPKVPECFSQRDSRMRLAVVDLHNERVHRVHMDALALEKVVFQTQNLCPSRLHFCRLTYAKVQSSLDPVQLAIDNERHGQQEKYVADVLSRWESTPPPDPGEPGRGWKTHGAVTT
ncbi:hypothetical protein FI667_g851, partial [Globisporangium splendens]